MDNIPFYNLVNKLFIGVIFLFCISVANTSLLDFIKINIESISDINEVKTIIYTVIFYFVGILLSQISSILLEPIYKKMNLIKWVDYKLFNSKKKEFPILEVLSREYATYRNLSGIFICSSVISLWFSCYSLMVVYIISLILSILNMRKNTKKISELIV